MIDLIVHNIMTYNNESKHFQKYHNKYSIFGMCLSIKVFILKMKKIKYYIPIKKNIQLKTM